MCKDYTRLEMTMKTEESLQERFIKLFLHFKEDKLVSLIHDF